MRRSALAMLGIAMVWTGAASSSASAAERCVGVEAHCHPSLQAALDASHDGDVIRVRRGTFAGGITIDRSVKLIGAGAGRTTIRGGGPVVTVGTFGASSEPTVTLRGLTITGGVTTSSGRCGPVCGENYAQATALGGGIAVPPGAGLAPGATVTIRDSVIAGNRAAPVFTVPSGRAVCPDGPCPFALGGGGGIDNWGRMTLKDTTVSDNQAGGAVTSDAEGGGILSEGGSLTLINSVVTRNRATGSLPNGRFAEGGGVVASGGTLTIAGGTVTRNEAELSASMLTTVDTGAHAGGVQVASEATGTIRGTTIAYNSVVATNLAGDAIGFVGGLGADGPLTLRDSTVSGNRVSATAASPSGNALADSGALGLGDAAASDVSRSRLADNSVSSTAPGGIAFAGAGAVGTGTTELTTIRRSLISGNRTTATSRTGSAEVQGAGIFNLALLELRGTSVRSNRGTASAPTGHAEGGGVWNSAFPDSPGPGELTLIDSAITHNALTASPGITPRGGGLFTTGAVTRRGSLIAGNAPDQCHGC